MNSKIKTICYFFAILLLIAGLVVFLVFTVYKTVGIISMVSGAAMLLVIALLPEKEYQKTTLFDKRREENQPDIVDKQNKDKTNKPSKKEKTISESAIQENKKSFNELSDDEKRTFVIDNISHFFKVVNNGNTEELHCKTTITGGCEIPFALYSTYAYKTGDVVSGTVYGVGLHLTNGFHLIYLYVTENFGILKLFREDDKITPGILFSIEYNKKYVDEAVETEKLKARDIKEQNYKKELRDEILKKYRD